MAHKKRTTDAHPLPRGHDDTADEQRGGGGAAVPGRAVSQGPAGQARSIILTDNAEYIGSGCMRHHIMGP
ncbi:hypothetical protein MY4824_000366 [Beauveria thailandica]